MDRTVEDEKPPPYVQYHSGDASVAFVTADQQPSQEPPNKARGCRCTALKSLGVAVTLCLITTVAALTLFFLQRADTADYGNSFLTNAAVAVRNLTVSYVGDDNFTLTWQKPESCVDHYTVMVTDNSDRSSGNASNGLVSCNKEGVITSSQTSVTCDQPVLCANATISVKPNVRGAANNTLSGETLSGVLLPGKYPPPVTDLQLSVITHRYFEITYKAPKECYSDFGHHVSRASSNSRARLSYCRVQKTSSRITATCNITACGKINIGAQTMSTGPSRRGSLWAELFGLNTKKRC